MSLTRQEQLDELDRVLASRTLQGSESLKAFLKFVVRQTVDSGSSSLKEYTIATEVFGRGETYDSRNDSVVRVQAGRLRAKLQEYYTSEGRNDPIVIELPKGHYTPVFSYPPPVATAEAPRSGLADLPVTQVGRRKSRQWYKIATASLAVLALVFGSIALDYRSDNSHLKQELASREKGVNDVQAALPIWDPLLKAPDPILVSFSNALFEGTAETGMKLMKPFEGPVQGVGEPAVPGATDTGEQSNSHSVITDHYTGVGEVMAMYSLASFFAKAGRTFRVKRSLLLTWDDVTAANIVFVGSPAENLLLRALPQHQDFVFRIIKEGVPSPTFGIVNTKPAAGEQNFYVANQEGPSRSQISEDYALISMVRGLDGQHRILILAGITTFGTQAAADYVTRPEFANEMIAHLNEARGSASPRLPEYYQVLVKVKVNGGVPVQMSYVTHHIL